MKKIKIAHLYYDLMNLYGENANLRILVKRLEAQNVEVKVSFLTINDKIDFTKYDLFYIGSGSERNQKLVLNDILIYQEEIIKAINNKKFFLITGNALELFGQYIEKLDDEKLICLKAFDYYTKETDFRIIGEQVYTTDLIDQQIIGFQNRSGVLNTNTNNSLFNVVEGTGYKPNAKYEGIHFNNFYGTYVIGPLLIRNPYFTEYLVKEILTNQKINYVYFW